MAPRHPIHTKASIRPGQSHENIKIPYGGWLPKGRMAEDGKVPAEYTAMVEMTRGG